MSYYPIKQRMEAIRKEILRQEDKINIKQINHRQKVRASTEHKENKQLNTIKNNFKKALDTFDEILKVTRQ
jgi:hypothetical protein